MNEWKNIVAGLVLGLIIASGLVVGMESRASSQEIGIPGVTVTVTEPVRIVETVVTTVTETVTETVTVPGPVQTVTIPGPTVTATERVPGGSRIAPTVTETVRVPGPTETVTVRERAPDSRPEPSPEPGPTPTVTERASPGIVNRTITTLADAPLWLVALAAGGGTLLLGVVAYFARNDERKHWSEWVRQLKRLTRR